MCVGGGGPKVENVSAGGMPPGIVPEYATGAEGFTPHRTVHTLLQAHSWRGGGGGGRFTFSIR